MIAKKRVPQVSAVKPPLITTKHKEHKKDLARDRGKGAADKFVILQIFQEKKLFFSRKIRNFEI